MDMTYTDFSFELVEEAEGYEDNTRRSAWRFRIGFPQTQQAFHALHRLAEDFQDFTGDLEEEFGTIDVYSQGATQVFGYQLLEIMPDRIADYAEQCRGWFQSHGYTCGPVEACTLEEYDNPDAHHPHAAWFQQAFQLGWEYKNAVDRLAPACYDGHMTEENTPMMDATPLARLTRYARLRDLQAHWGVEDSIATINLGTVQAPLLASDLRVLLAEHAAQAAEITQLKQLMAKACLQWSLDPQDQWLRDDGQADAERMVKDAEDFARARRQSQVLLDDGSWLVVIPDTEFAAEFYGRGTRWCTTTRGDPTQISLFDGHRQKGPLVIVINRNAPHELYQFYWSTGLFMDHTDRPVPPADIIRLGLDNPALARVLIPHVPVMAAAFGSEDQQLAAVRRDGWAIRWIDNPTEAVKMAAVERTSQVIRCIDNPTEAMQLVVVRKRGLSIESIRNPTEAVQRAAIEQDGRAIRHIDNPSPAIVELARRRGYNRQGNSIR